MNSVEQMRALGHPLRNRALYLLVEEQYTNKQLASALGEPPSRVHFHIRELLKAGLIEIVDQRLKGGIMEKYYRAVSRSLRLGTDLGVLSKFDELADTILLTARDEFESSTNFFKKYPPETQIVQEKKKLSPERFSRIKEHLKSISEELEKSQTDANAEDAINIMLTYMIHRLPDDTEVEANETEE
ncbi:winged helix-turn-helix domain-containing protein [Halobacillus shinanisalinarum]|uniref:Winged helix-turn-helix domain-containing protein n=1 Tax=Halobacillus shinanisalinarum TaxID=2932258 RepID=A0ABY4GU39_9BACI|nr:winged helix-turn-helix domain-containing protein [Halobacillus shinanisalinarum]UOQ91456.1 winged helix-turn-helix domain-containing protein [Halobacillus shinanisalinarum]